MDIYKKEKKHLSVIYTCQYYPFVVLMKGNFISLTFFHIKFFCLDDLFFKKFLSISHSLSLALYIYIYMKEICVRLDKFTRRDISIFYFKNFFSVKYFLSLYIYHHHHVALVAWISLTLSRHSSLSFIALGRSSGQHPVSSHSCWIYVRAGRPAFEGPCVGVHKSTSLMSSSLLLKQCPACLVRLTWIVFLIGGRCPYSSCLAGCCRQDLFKITRSILV